ncbi:TetR/AcrR family transcriptional regulator [Pseudomonas sp. NFACC07-1]|uniref:TetR/AcrR family transcriptional regulator n=1 Tax=Pseudomonas sp. NFACC07-1 TaxID=1566239 RepID=UPI0008C55906|nr:TetR/AcrR family transcriptional regulator [Pseudomonas sp. NFACC07-1]SEI53958.1 transcriptional regulator, TetR family [Pseudomonas sp. NFACC07-1]
MKQTISTGATLTDAATPSDELRKPRRGRPPLADGPRLEQHLLDIAHRLFVANGYDVTTMDSIAVEARVSKRTLYLRYPRKELLFAAVVADHTARSFAAVQAVLARFESDPELDLRARLQMLGHVFVEQAVNPDTLSLDRSMATTAQRFPELLDSLHRAGYERATSIVQALLSEAGAMESAISAQAFYSLLVLAPIRERLRDGKQQVPDVDRVVDFITAGARIAPTC